MTAQHDADQPPRRGPGRPRARPLEVDRRHVLDAARALCAERGFDGTSVEAIAQRASVARPSVYEQFGSRQELMAATVEDAADLLSERVTKALAEPGERWPDAVRHTFEALFTLVEEEPDALTVLFLAEQSSAFSPESGLGSARKRVIGEVAAVAREHWRIEGHEVDLAADLLALMLFTLGDAVARRQIADGLDKAALIKLLTTFTIGGVVTVTDEPGTLAAVDDAAP